MAKGKTSIVGSITGRHGAPVDTSPEARFGKKVKVMQNGCWAFNGDLHSYHPFVAGSTIDTITKAHRFAYETLVGPLVEGMHIHHTCQHQGCVNPAHLEQVTPAEHKARHRDLAA